MDEWEQFKVEICEIGDRLYRRGFAAANDGNITYRASDDRVLCTPTMVCKGFMKPSDICVVDMDGTQMAGARKRSSEVMLHLEIMQKRSDVKSIVHCHPPHATAFAVAREPIPQGILPEVELFLGNVATAQYQIPGSQMLAESVLPYIDQTNIVLLANHGTVSVGETVERAYWWTEILDHYCRILLLAKHLGHVEYLSRSQCDELLAIKENWGFSDARLAEEHLQDDPRTNSVFRHNWQTSGFAPRAFPQPCDTSAVL